MHASSRIVAGWVYISEQGVHCIHYLELQISILAAKIFLIHHCTGSVL